MTLSYSFTWIIIIIICPLVVRSSITDRFWCNLNWWIKEYNFDRIFDFPWPVSFHNSIPKFCNFEGAKRKRKIIRTLETEHTLWFAGFRGCFSRVKTSTSINDEPISKQSLYAQVCKREYRKLLQSGN